MANYHGPLNAGQMGNALSLLVHLHCQYVLLLFRQELVIVLAPDARLGDSPRILPKTKLYFSSGDIHMG